MAPPLHEYHEALVWLRRGCAWNATPAAAWTARATRAGSATAV